MMFELLDASTEQKNVGSEKDAIKLLESVDVWLRRNAIGASRQQQSFLDQSRNCPISWRHKNQT